MHNIFVLAVKLFQSTPPVKAATVAVAPFDGFSLFQSTPPVKAATTTMTTTAARPPFQSTPPVKAATTELGYIKANTDISIHAAREGGDVQAIIICTLNGYFNPRRP